jgi:hypothetical protein
MKRPAGSVAVGQINGQVDCEVSYDLKIISEEWMALPQDFRHSLDEFEVPAEEQAD